MSSPCLALFLAFFSFNSVLGNSCGGRGLDDVIVTEPPVTELPAPAATGIFASTSVGLIALDLQTLKSTVLTREYTLAVAVNENLRKVYWSELSYNSRIIRSNFNGSDTEIIVPPASDSISMLAIDEPSGAVYFSVGGSHQITVCNEKGENCAAVISNSSLVNRAVGIALDSDNGVMYWSNIGSVPSSLVRANMDGSNATIISTEFTVLLGITLDQPSNVLYWADLGENAVGTIDVDGGNKQTLVQLEGFPGPWGIQVDAHKMYIGNWGGRNIQSAARDSGQELTTVFNSTENVNHVALFNAPT